MLGAKKAATREAEFLVVGFSCEVEAQSRDFAVAAGQELRHAPGDEVFVNLDFYRFMLTCVFDGEACFDVYNGELEKWPLFAGIENCQIAVLKALEIVRAPPRGVNESQTHRSPGAGQTH